MRPDGKTRRYRRALFEVPKGNGKTPLSGWVGLYELCGPGRSSPLIPVAAASYAQADLLFGDMRAAATESPTLSQVLEPFEGEIQIAGGAPGRAYKVAAVAGTNDGQRPSAFLADEIHEWTGNKARVHLVISNGTAKRRNSLVLNTTTPGSDLESMAGKLHTYGLAVNAGEIDDDEFLFVWYSADDIYDLDDPAELEAAVRTANPAADTFLRVPDVMSRFHQMPRFEFERYHLARWTTVGESWLPPGAWDACADTARAVPDGTEIVLGFDGSVNNDSTALVACTVEPTPHLFVVDAWERPAEANAHWAVPIIDVEERIRQACRRWSVRSVMCDPFRWSRSLQILEAEGLPMVEFPQTMVRMTPATSRFYEAAVNRQLTHSGDPRLARHIANATLRTDARGSRLSKEHRESSRKIDLAVAAVMAHDGAWSVEDQDDGELHIW